MTETRASSSLGLSMRCFLVSISERLRSVSRLVVLCIFLMLSVADGYSNATLTSGDLEVTVFLPFGVKPAEDTYYMGTRFEHGSMIGPIKRKTTQVLEADGKVGELVEKVHTLFGNDLWRLPHNAGWPESAVGLASEFGVGDDGNFCPYRCGWDSREGVTNGVLGYETAKMGESFLKIGVGELVKGSCPRCDSAEVYKFNSPYKFAQPPVWNMEMSSTDTLRLDHSAILGDHGYRVAKEIVVRNDLLTVRTTLTNLGTEQFTTAWYSHNFFTCDSAPVGPGYSVDLGIRGNRSPLYGEPGTWSWATPLRQFAAVEPHPDSIHIKMRSSVPPGIRIKAEFLPDTQSTGTFSLNACRNIVRSSLIGDTGALDMYAFNLYVEQGTLSPEPQILLHLEPGASQSWTQRLEFDDQPLPNSQEFEQVLNLRTVDIAPGASALDRQVFSPSQSVGIVLVVVALAALNLALAGLWSRRQWSKRTHSYEAIPDTTDPCDDER